MHHDESSNDPPRPHRCFFWIAIHCEQTVPSNGHEPVVSASELSTFSQPSTSYKLVVSDPGYWGKAHFVSSRKPQKADIFFVSCTSCASAYWFTPNTTTTVYITTTRRICISIKQIVVVIDPVHIKTRYLPYPLSRTNGDYVYDNNRSEKRNRELP